MLTTRPRINFEDQNASGGFNEQQLGKSLIVFIFSYWEVEIHKRFAAALSVKDKEVKIPGFGDLRILRNGIMHHRNGLPSENHAKLEIVRDLFEPEEKIKLDAKTVGKVLERL